MTVLLYDFSFKNEYFATFTFVVKGMFNIQSKTSKDFLTSFSNCYQNSLIYSILHFRVNSLNREYKMLS